MSQQGPSSPAAQYQPYYGTTDGAQMPAPHQGAPLAAAPQPQGGATAAINQEAHRQPVYSPMQSTFEEHCAQLQPYGMAFAVLIIPAFACCWATYYIGIPLGVVLILMAGIIRRFADPTSEYARDAKRWNTAMFLSIATTVLGAIGTVSAGMAFLFWTHWMVVRILFSLVGLGVAISSVVLGYLTLRRVNDVRLHHLAEKPGHVVYNANTKYTEVV